MDGKVELVRHNTGHCVKAVARGHARLDLDSGSVRSINLIAKHKGVTARYVARPPDLAFTQAGRGDPPILDGRQPADGRAAEPVGAAVGLVGT